MELYSLPHHHTNHHHRSHTLILLCHGSRHCVRETIPHHHNPITHPHHHRDHSLGHTAVLTCAWTADSVNPCCQVLNSLDLDMVRLLTPMMRSWDADADAKVILLKGTGEKVRALSLHNLFSASSESETRFFVAALRMFECVGDTECQVI